MMRIAVFSDCYFPAINGVVTSVSLQLEALRKMGHEVDLICPNYGGLGGDEDGVLRFSSVPFPFHRREQLAFPWPLSKIEKLAGRSYDVVHLQTPFTVGLMGLFFSQVRAIPRIFHHHTLWEEYVDYLPLPKGLTSHLSVVLCRALANICDGVVAPSRQVKERFQGQGVRVPIEVVPTGIRAELFQGGKIRTERSEGDSICLYIGRLAHEKSVDSVVRVFQRVLEAHPEARLWLVGDGPARGSLETLVEGLGLSDVVKFFGFVPRDSLKDFVASADVFVFASLTETQGLVLLEAQAGGLPVVAFGAGGVSEAVFPGRTGYLIEPAREDQMAEAVVRLLGDDKERARCSKSAVRWAENFSLERMGEQLVSVYETVINLSQTREK